MIQDIEKNEPKQIAQELRVFIENILANPLSTSDTQKAIKISINIVLLMIEQISEIQEKSKTEKAINKWIDVMVEFGYMIQKENINAV
jgi:hypothetical protein